MTVLGNLRTCGMSLLVAGCACSGPAAEPGSETEPSRTYVVASVERHDSAGQLRPETLSVLLSAVRMPLALNGDRTLKLMGLRTDLPQLGTCEVIDQANRASPALSSVDQIELLDVGDVSVTSGKRSIQLARQAFPTVTDFISGVVYTSRDKHADLLPLTTGLSIRARGGSKLKSFGIDVPDVPQLQRLTLDGTPWLEVARLSLVNGFELRWDKGASGDVLWMELNASGGHKVISCAFEDGDGVARVPAGLTDEVGEARLVSHRLRHAPATVPGSERAEIRFDSHSAHTLTLY